MATTLDALLVWPAIAFSVGLGCGSLLGGWIIWRLWEQHIETCRRDESATVRPRAER